MTRATNSYILFFKKMASKAIEYMLGFYFLFGALVLFCLRLINIFSESMMETLRLQEPK